jgi:hypothetical protein
MNFSWENHGKIHHKYGKTHGKPWIFSWMFHHFFGKKKTNPGDHGIQRMLVSDPKMDGSANIKHSKRSWPTLVDDTFPFQDAHFILPPIING